jgi:hypothetical protein
MAILPIPDSFPSGTKFFETSSGYLFILSEAIWFAVAGLGMVELTGSSPRAVSSDEISEDKFRQFLPKDKTPL